MLLLHCKILVYNFELQYLETIRGNCHEQYPKFITCFLYFFSFKLFVILVSSNQYYLQPNDAVPKKVIFFSKDNKVLPFSLPKDRENTVVRY